MVENKRLKLKACNFWFIKWNERIHFACCGWLMGSIRMVMVVVMELNCCFHQELMILYVSHDYSFRSMSKIEISVGKCLNFSWFTYSTFSVHLLFYLLLLTIWNPKRSHCGWDCIWNGFRKRQQQFPKIEEWNGKKPNTHKPFRVN